MATATTKDLELPADTPLAPPARGARLWPAVLLVALYWIGRYGVVAVAAGQFTHVMYLFWAPLWVGLLLLIWLLGFSRLTWLDRGWVVLSLALGAAVTALLVHRSMTLGLYMYALPMAMTALVIWLVVTKAVSTWPNRLLLLAATFIAFGYFALLRLDGVDGALNPELSWRWTTTPEQEFLATQTSLPAAEPAAIAPIDLPSVASERDWPAFRGALRDGVIRGVTIGRDWNASPPKEVWRKRVGPGWSSFAVVGDYAFTQEQRGDDEAVVCFEVPSGKEVWSHRDKARFEETVAGAGPRATPTFEGGKLYTQGGAGQLNCLDATTGQPLWSQDIAKDAHAQPPQWGFSSSPLIVQGLVLAVPAGKEGKSLLAYDAETGELKWKAGKGTHTYSSPQLWNGGGTPQVLLVSDYGLESFDPATGQILWEHAWQNSGIFRVVQPLADEKYGLLLGTGMGIGTRQLKVSPGSDGKWTIDEGWTSKDIKPYFNDFVLYEGHLYGFDNDLFTCISLETGKRAWKKGRYGAGQVLLVQESGLLLVVSENTGELILLEANPKQHVELGRIKAVEGKTWNHPVLVPPSEKAGPLLLLRNGQEMACYELSGG
jgi:outer membrane protein assembly factor BamB